MRITKLFLAGGLLGWSIAATAVAQGVATQEVYVPEPVRPVSFAYDSYLGDEVQDASTAKSKAAADATADDTDGKTSSDPGDNGNGSPCRLCMKGRLAEPWTLPQADFLKERQIVVSGWLSGGIYGNQYGNPSNGPIGLRNVGDGPTADQLWLSIDRKTDTKGCGWDIGGHVDYMFGADGPDTQAFGDRTWDYGWNSARDYGSAIPQLYAEIAYNDWKVKVGRFYTPIGYEVVQAPQNFFYSHSYSHTFGEPFTHTGALAAYQRNEMVTYYAGWTDGWDEGFADKNNGSTFLGGLSINFSEKTTFAWYVSAGKIGDGTAYVGAASGDIYYNCFVFTHKITDKLTYVFEHDLGSNYNVNLGGVGDNQWYQVNNYLTYKLNDCWSVGGRLEWFQDPQGARVNPGSCGNYYSLTGGVNYKPHANITIRPEIRYDTFNSFASSTALPFNNGQSSSQLSGGFDMIFTY